MKDIKIYKEFSRQLRINIIKMLAHCKSGHPGGSLSIADILSVLVNGIIRDEFNLKNYHRDRFVLSKGHAVPALYAALYLKGKLTEEDLLSLRKVNSRLQGHPSRMFMPEVEASTGSLGQGLSVAQGFAIASKLENYAFDVYAIIGDGEMQEGQIWECAMSAPNFKLHNLTVILDYNKAQIDGHIKDIMNLEPIKAKWESFGWQAIEIDGHNFKEIYNALEEVKKNKQSPGFIIANTVKGKGVSFMENDVSWHGKAPSEEEAEKAIEEILKS